MRPRTDPVVAPWIAKRDEDLAAMETLLERAPHLHDATGFHAQQAAEKGLKGLLAAAGQEPPHTHDLVLLLAVLQDAVGNVAVDPRDCQTLTPFAVLSRYPRHANGGVPPLDVAVAACRRIATAVDDALPRADDES